MNNIWTTYDPYRPLWFVNWNGTRFTNTFWALLYLLSNAWDVPCVLYNRHGLLKLDTRPISQNRQIYQANQQEFWSKQNFRFTGRAWNILFHPLVRVPCGFPKITRRFQHCISHITFYNVTVTGWLPAKVASRVENLTGHNQHFTSIWLVVSVQFIPCLQDHWW